MSGETTTTSTEGLGGDSPEHIQAMVDRADGKTPPASDPADGGEGLLAGKFKTPEELEKGYLELQKAFSSRSTDDTAGSDEGADNGESEGGDGESAAEPTSADLPDRTEEGAEGDAEGIDFSKYAQSFADNGGSLTDDDYKELQEKHNLPKDVVDVYVRGLQTLQTDRTQAAVNAVGSSEEFEKVRNWASENLSEKEYTSVQNAIRNAQTAEDVGVVYGMLAQRYRVANPSEPALLTGDGGAPASTPGFASRTQMSEAINDPRYEKDPAYRKEVEAKIAKSKFL